MVERVVEGAEQVDVEVEGLDELVAEVGVQADGHLVDDPGDDDQGPVEQGHDVVVLLLVVVLLHLLPDAVVERDHLVGQVVEEDQRTLERLHLHRVLVVHLALEPPHEAVHLDAYHAF